MTKSGRLTCPWHGGKLPLPPVRTLPSIGLSGNLRTNPCPPPAGSLLQCKDW
jgi:hypothetical protein